MSQQPFRFACPHCEGLVEVMPNEINCRIFSHGIFRDNGQQIPPHLPKTAAEELLRGNKIHGCGKQFRFFIDEHSIQHIEKCEDK